MSGSEAFLDGRASGEWLPVGRWFDGQTPKGTAVTLAMEGEELHLREGDAVRRRYRRREVTWPEHTRHGALQVLLPDGGVVAMDDRAAWEGWARLQGIEQPAAVRWALSWRSSAVALVVMVGLLFSAVRWGLPWAAEEVAPRVPLAARLQLDRAVMAQMHERGWLEPHALRPDVASRLQAEVDRMVEAAYPLGRRPRIKVDVYRMPERIGPNAMALPGGQIVISEALLTLLPMQGERFHPGVLGVLAHELGHVHEQHGIRQLLTVSVAGALMGWWIGDYSALLAGAPTVLMHLAYSRRFEREADDEALRIMRAADIDPRGMVQFFEALNHANPGRDDAAPPIGLATHPPDAERIRLFGTGRR